MKTQKYTPHIFALCALTVSQPLYTTNNLWFVIISVILSSVILLLFCHLINLGAKNKTAFRVAVLFSCIAAIYGAITAFIDYIRFLKTVQLPQTNIILLAISFIAVIVVFAANENRAIYKYGLLVAVAVVIMTLICFIGGIKNFDFNLLEIEFTKPRFSFTTFVQGCAFVAAIPIFIFTQNQRLPTKTLLSGVWLGFASLALCTAQSVLTLGSANFDYPYLSAVSVISSGSLFTRLDGLVYFMFFAFATVRVTICIKVVINAVKHIYFCSKSAIISPESTMIHN